MIKVTTVSLKPGGVRYPLAEGFKRRVIGCVLILGVKSVTSKPPSTSSRRPAVGGIFHQLGPRVWPWQYW